MNDFFEITSDGSTPRIFHWVIDKPSTHGIREHVKDVRIEIFICTHYMIVKILLKSKFGHIAL